MESHSVLGFDHCSQSLPNEMFWRKKHLGGVEVPTILKSKEVNQKLGQHAN